MQCFGSNIDIVIFFNLLLILNLQIALTTSIKASHEKVEASKEEVGSMWSENTEEQRETNGGADIRVPLCIQVCVFTVQYRQESKEQLVSWIEVHIYQEDYHSDVDVL